RRGVRPMGEVGNQEHRRHAERLTQLQPATEVVEVGLALFALREEQTALVRGRGGDKFTIGEQPTREVERVRFEVLFELGQPQFGSPPADVAERGQVVGERRGKGRRLTDAEFHSAVRWSPFLDLLFSFFSTFGGLSWVGLAANGFGMIPKKPRQMSMPVRCKISPPINIALFLPVAW